MTNSRKGAAQLPAFYLNVSSMGGTARLFALTGGAPFEKGAPPDPHPKTFDNLGRGVIVYN